MIHRNVKCVFFALMGLLLLFNTVVNTGADENIDIFPIKAVPDIGTYGSIIQGQSELNGKGTIQRVGKDEVGEKLIVIDDRLMYVAPGIKYYNVKGEPVSPSKFYKGKRVGYNFNKQRKITDLHLISD